MNTAKLAFAACLVGVTPAFAGNVITANLPSNTVIVNIDARNDGAASSASFDGTPFALWYNPFSNSGAANILEYTVAPGTYTFRVIDSADAAALFPSLTPSQLSTIQAGWTFNSPWLTDYLVFDSSALTNSSAQQLFTGSVESGTYGDAEAAYAAAKSQGVFDMINTGPDGRYEGTPGSSYTFTSTTTLVFAIPDSGVSDNNGGPSVVIAPLPEPASLATLALGCAVLLRSRRRRRC